MKFSISTFLVLLPLMQGCGPSAAASPRGLSVVDAAGRAGTLGAQPEDHVIAVATWCGYSEEFVRLVKDPRIARYLTGDSIRFVLGDEWSKIEESIDAQIAEGDLDPDAKAAYKQQFEADADPVVLANPAFLDELPGEYFFVEEFQGELGFPARYAPGVHPFESHAFMALVDAGVPERVLVEVVEEYRK